MHIGFRPPNKNFMQEIYNELKSDTSDQIYTQVSEIWDKVELSVWNQLGTQLGTHVRGDNAQLGTHVRGDND